MSLSHGDHYDYEVESLKNGKQKDMSHDNHFNFEINKSLKNGKQKGGTKHKSLTKQKRRKHKGFKSRNHRRGVKGRKLRVGKRNEKDEVIKSLNHACCTVDGINHVFFRGLYKEALR